MSRGPLRHLLSVIVAITAASGHGAAGAHATTIPPAATDMTSQTAATITFANFAYSPPLLAVGRSGTAPAELTWSGAFASHPLRFEAPGIAGAGSGSTTTRELRSGRYAFFCNFHGSSLGMKGEVYVAGPRAALSAAPADVSPGGTVKLDAAATDLVSLGSATATYAFDPEGDGSFLAAGSATSVQATYPAAGSFPARVRVTDDSGRVDEASFDVDVAVPGTAPPPGAGNPPADGTPGTTTPSGTTGTTTRPGGAKTPGERAAVRFTDVVTLPRSDRCVNRRRGVRIRIRDRSGANVRSARVVVNGRTVRSRSSIGRDVTLVVRPLPGRRPLVRVVVTLAGGDRLSRTTRYRTCR